MWRLLILTILFISASSVVKTRLVNQQLSIDRHNHYRKMVHVPKLKFSQECADNAQEWAEYLAKNNTGLSHSNTTEFGENIYWNSGRSSEIMMVDQWALEKKYFSEKSRKHSHKNQHYSQVIWRTTKYVGVGMAIANDGSEYWVASYYPVGNYLGEKAY
jgi:hypothetical protein